MFHNLPTIEYNNYYRYDNNLCPSSKRLKKIIEDFKKNTGYEPTILDDDKNVYYHPYVFHFIAELTNMDYFISSAKEMTKSIVKKSEPSVKIITTIEDNKPTKEMSSYNIGKGGEEIVLNTIKEVKPLYDISKVSATGHVGDIHVIDNTNMIKYLVEVKDKGVITKDDLTKFDNDMKALQRSNTLIYKHIYGIFISLEADSIPSIGKCKITTSQVYLGKSMFSKDTLNIIFSMVESLSVISEVSINKQIYDIPPKVYELVSRLRLEYNIIINEEDIYKNMITNCENNLLSVNRLQRNNTIKKDFIKFINDEFSNVLPIIDDGINRKEEDRLRAYIASHKKKEIYKKTLINEFPSFVTELSSMKLNDFINKYT